MPAMPTAGDYSSGRPSAATVTATVGRSRVAEIALVWLLLVVGFALRLYGLDRPPIDFHPSRQYRSALIARSMYLQGADQDARTLAAHAAAEREWSLEPTVNEWLASVIYRFVGKEDLRLARLISVTWWIIGGVFLYLAGAHVGSRFARVVAVAFHLFVPYGVVASRSFQPDPLMIMLFLCGVWLTLAALMRPARGRVTAAVIACALAGMVKPMCLIPLAALYLAGMAATRGAREWRRLSTWLLSGAAMAPAALYYAGLFWLEGTMARQVGGRFTLHLALTRLFWEGWLHMLWIVIGYHALLGAALGCLLARERLARVVLASLWLGYLMYALLFTYHTYTHDYYHLMLIPIVALSLIPLVDAVVGAMRGLHRAWLVRGAMFGAVLAGVGLASHKGPWLREGIAAEGFVKDAQEIGEHVSHSARTIFISFGNGKPLEYHARIAGIYWPNTGDLFAERIRFGRTPAISERFEKTLNRSGAEYFIITDLPEFDRQSELRELLVRRFPVLVATRGYAIFDLRGAASEP